MKAMIDRVLELLWQWAIWFIALVIIRTFIPVQLHAITGLIVGTLVTWWRVKARLVDALAETKRLQELIETRIAELEHRVERKIIPLNHARFDDLHLN
jgi:hypothetical protein